LAVYAVVGAAGSTSLPLLAGALGVAVVLAALVAAWDDGLIVGPALLLLAYALSLLSHDSAVDRRAPLVAAALLAVVELGSWSLELREGAEERPLARLPSILLLLVAAFAATAVVLAFGAVRSDAGLAVWALGVAAAIGLLGLIAASSRAAGAAG
jgi:hypothetical protein